MAKPKIIFEGGAHNINPEPVKEVKSAILEMPPILSEQGQHTSNLLHETIKGPDIDERVQNTRIFQNKLRGSMEYGAYRALDACQYAEEQITDIMSIFGPLFTIWFKDTFGAPNVAANYNFRRKFYESFETMFADNMSHSIIQLVSEFSQIRKQDISITGYKYKKLFTDALKRTYDLIKKNYDIVDVERTNSEDETGGVSDNINMRFNLN